MFGLVGQVIGLESQTFVPTLNSFFYISGPRVSPEAQREPSVKADGANIVCMLLVHDGWGRDLQNTQPCEK